MSKIKNIGIFTSIRSEYGLLSPLIRLIDKDSDFNLKLLVGGAHLSSEFGETINQIKIDGFNIDSTFDFLDRKDSRDFSTRSIGKLQIQIGEYFSENSIDLLIVLGDRYELIPVVTAALLNQIPIAHISGGETTEGAIDNQIRHAITKMSHLHFPATEVYGKNIKRMGEESWRICVSGEPGLDEVLKLDYISKTDLFSDLGLDYDKQTICCTFHPQTIDNKITIEFVKECLLSIVKKTNFQILITAANFDNGGKEINLMLEELSSENNSIIYVKSLGQKRYYSLLKYADLMLGNSSSGLVEAQSFNLPVINVGNRQQGRLTNPNVIQCKIEIEDVLESLEKALSKNFKVEFLNKPNIYGNGDACVKIIKFIKSQNLSKLFFKKDVFE